MSSIGWTDPEGTRPFLAALLLAYYDPEGRLIYAGHAGTGIGPLGTSNGCGAACSRWRPPICRSTWRRRATAASDRRWTLSRVHWVRPELETQAILARNWKFESISLQQPVRLSPDFSFPYRKAGGCRGVGGPGQAARPAETRRASQHHANCRQRLCRALFQYRSAG